MQASAKENLRILLYTLSVRLFLNTITEVRVRQDGSDRAQKFWID